MKPNASPSHHPEGRARIVSWTARVVAAAIFAMTLPSKFGGAPEAVALFETLGVEPFGRLGLGAFEALAVVLLLVPRLAAIGGVLTVGLLSGAVLAHLTVLGVAFGGDASLFTMAVVGLVAGAVVSWTGRRELPVIGCRFGACAPREHSTHTAV